MTRLPGEDGFAAPVVVGLAAVLVVATLLGAALGRLLVDQRRVAAAADLAALAGASAVQLGRDGCRDAAEVADDNGAVLLSCVVADQRVQVEAGISSPTLLHRVVELHATAHAGPRR